MEQTILKIVKSPSRSLNVKETRLGTFWFQNFALRLGLHDNYYFGVNCCKSHKYSCNFDCI